MSELDFLLRKAIKSGLNYLSLSPNHVSPKDSAWCAAYRHTENANCQYVSDDDPVEALRKAIDKGEREVKAQRKWREEVHEPLKEDLKKTQRKSAAKVVKTQETKDAVSAKRRREADDLI
jgi:anti-sigma28 factor (negative regulator of flagellin synthesis)